MLRKRKNDYPFEEWKECRNSIGKFDSIIIDIRKYGFSLITGMLSAEAILFVKIDNLSSLSRAAVSIIMMLLVFALFMVDRYHEVFLRSAVKRATEIEPKLGMKTTWTISDLSIKANTDTWGIKLYILFVIASGFPSLAVSFPNIMTSDLQNILAIILVLAAMIAFITAIGVYHKKTSIAELRENA